MKTKTLPEDNNIFRNWTTNKIALDVVVVRDFRQWYRISRFEYIKNKNVFYV